MKGCFIAIAVILVVIIVLLGAAAVYLFAFEKELPQSAIDEIMKNFDGMGDASVPYSIDILNQFDDLNSTNTMTITSTTTNEEVIHKYNINKTGKNETLKLIYEESSGTSLSELEVVAAATFYIEDGKYISYSNSVKTEMDQSEWESAVLDAFIIATPFYKDGDVMKLQGGTAIEDNLSKVTQKGFIVKAYASENGVNYTMIFNLQSLELVSYKIEAEAANIKTTSEYNIDLDVQKLLNI